MSSNLNVKFKIPYFHPKIPFKKYNRWKILKIRVGGTYIHIRKEEGMCILGTVFPGTVVLHSLLLLNDDLIIRDLKFVSKSKILGKLQAEYLLQTMKIEVTYNLLWDIHYYKEELKFADNSELDPDIQNIVNSELENNFLDPDAMRLDENAG
jgi:hypothetical protein